MVVLIHRSACFKMFNSLGRIGIYANMYELGY